MMARLPTASIGSKAAAAAAEIQPRRRPRTLIARPATSRRPGRLCSNQRRSTSVRDGEAPGRSGRVVIGDDCAERTSADYADYADFSDLGSWHYRDSVPTLQVFPNPARFNSLSAQSVCQNNLRNLRNLRISVSAYSTVVLRNRSPREF